MEAHRRISTYVGASSAPRLSLPAAASLAEVPDPGGKRSTGGSGSAPRQRPTACWQAEQQQTVLARKKTRNSSIAIITQRKTHESITNCTSCAQIKMQTRRFSSCLSSYLFGRSVGCASLMLEFWCLCYIHFLLKVSCNYLEVKEERDTKNDIIFFWKVNAFII